MKTKLGSNTAKERKKLIKQCDDLVSLIVRKRDRYCVCCGASERLQCGHLIKRGKSSTRFSLINCNCQCSSCNFKHNHYPEYYTNWFLTRYGIEMFKVLVKESDQEKQWRVLELRKLKENLQKQLRDLEEKSKDFGEVQYNSRIGQISHEDALQSTNSVKTCYGTAKTVRGL